MHDLDRTQAEYYPQVGEFESDEFEYETDEFEYETGESQAYSGYEFNTVFSEADELALAAELLEVTDEAELDQFLGKLIRGAGKALGKVVKGPLGKTIGGMLKGVAKTALPILGNAILPGVGGVLASGAGSMLGLELEGLSDEDQEFEIAKQLVRLGGEAVKQAGNAPSNMPPQVVAKNAMVKAARTYAPGLVGSPTTGQGGAMRVSGRRSGRWVRRGNKLVLYGL